MDIAGRLHTRRAFAQLQRAERSYGAGHHAEALPLFEAALRRLRQLHERYPDEPRRFDVYAVAQLNNIGLCLGKLGRQREAVAPLTEAVGAYEAMAATDPDTWNPYVAGTLCTLASVQGDLGHHDQAIATNARVLELRRAAAGPGAGADARHGLAVALRQFAHLRANAGRELGAAEDAVSEAQAVHMQLMSEDPQRYLPEIYMTQTVVAVVLQAMGRHDEAQRVMASVQRRDLDQVSALLAAQQRPPGG